ncbi:MAG TPA: Trm112 family protein [Longimicrobium sp.]|nr:Trm112 family protein [Longimicrobium sp.]
MHILLTDLLTCPRCGPELGLVLLADRIEERRVVQGRLGCANCRETYPVRDGVADLRLPGAGDDESPRPSDEDAEASPLSRAAGEGGEGAVRLAALLGLQGVSGLVLLAGPGAEHAAAVHALVPEAEVVALRAAPAGGGEAGVSRVAAGPALPFRDGKLRGVALTGGADAALLREGLRVLAHGSRLVVDPASPETAGTVRGYGAEVLLEQDGVVVARAPGRPVELRLNALR